METMVTEKRLAYLARLVRSGSDALYGSLQTTVVNDGKEITVPWCTTMREDLARFRARLGSKVDELGDPDTCWARWRDIMSDRSARRQLLKFYVQCTIRDQVIIGRGSEKNQNKSIMKSCLSDVCSACKALPY